MPPRFFPLPLAVRAPQYVPAASLASVASVLSKVGIGKERPHDAGSEKSAQAKAEAVPDLDHLQELPNAEFWSHVFEEIKENYAGRNIEGANIEKWLKKPRDAVKKGDIVLEVEICGAVIDLRSETTGFLGPHLADEGALLEKGMVAARILAAPAPLPSVSKMEMDKAMSEAEGSISSLQQALTNLELMRTKVIEDLAAAYTLASEQSLSDSIEDCLTAVVPGQEASLFVAPIGFLWPEVSKELLQQVDIEPAAQGVRSDAPKGAPGQALPVDLRSVALHGAILRARPGTSCILQTSMPYTTSLSCAQGPQALTALFHSRDAEERFRGLIVYDAGGACQDPVEEGQRLATLLGGQQRILLLAGRGVLVAGSSIAEAYHDLSHLERVAKVALLAAQSKLPLAPAVILAQPATGAATGQCKARAVAHFEALKRHLKRTRERSIPSH